MEAAKHLYLGITQRLCPNAYWPTRWQLKLKSDLWSKGLIQIEQDTIRLCMQENRCRNILDVGCGHGELRRLPDYTGLDVDPKVLKQANLPKSIVGDITDPDLPIPNKSFDCVMTRYVLLHIPFGKIHVATENIKRIAKKLIMLREHTTEQPYKSHSHCYIHNLDVLFSDFDGEVIYFNPMEKDLF